jgi:DNA-binding transcriptional ArsR family regulator
MALPPPLRMRMEDMPNEALDQVAAYFQALSEPTRLQILNFLRDGERNVGELANLCGYTAANISRHLAMLAQYGLVSRESRGTSAYYRIADPSIYELCDMVCGNVARQVERTARDGEVFVQSALRSDSSKRGK